jgi:hypothetical protein
MLKKQPQATDDKAKSQSRTNQYSERILNKTHLHPRPLVAIFQLGPSERKPEAYCPKYVEGLSEVRTTLGERRV